ncbi:TPA: hypothetical protein VB845_001437 [Streptococcus suis]|nr:hypothetical protein [Streptococcus suis]
MSKVETRPSKGPHFEPLIEKLPLVTVVYLSYSDTYSFSNEMIDIMNNLFSKNDQKVKLLVVLENKKKFLCKLWSFYSSDRNMQTKIQHINDNLSKYARVLYKDVIAFDNSSSVSNTVRVKVLEKIQKFIENSEFNKSTFPAKFYYLGDTYPNKYYGEISHEEIKTLDCFRIDYLQKSYGKRCDELYTNASTLFKKHISSRNSVLHIDPPDQQEQTDGVIKWNLPHMHVAKKYAFYLIDYFFDIEENVDNHWKHDNGGKSSFQLQNSIKDVISNEEYDFVIPVDID